MARHEPNRKSLAVALLAAFVAVTLLVGALAMLFGGQVRQKAQELAQENPAPTSPVEEAAPAAQAGNTEPQPEDKPIETEEVEVEVEQVEEEIPEDDKKEGV